MSKPQASKRARNIKRIERTDRPPKPQPEEEGRYMWPKKNQGKRLLYPADVDVVRDEEGRLLGYLVERHLLSGDG